MASICEDIHAVHPHVCGENFFRTAGSDSGSGSSPRVWGKRSIFTRSAGKFGSSPRVWGKLTNGSLSDCAVGSSPRVWGKLSGPKFLIAAHRFIPTCVGKTTRNNRRIMWRNGSSPRVWGKRLRLAHLDYCWRFIPTCVGKTAMPKTSVPVRVGSSPRVWGKRCSVRARPFPDTVHPHVCGENSSGSLAQRAPFTVHPHVCGENAHILFGCFAMVRFIPTCVGKTLRKKCAS